MPRATPPVHAETLFKLLFIESQFQNTIARYQAQFPRGVARNATFRDCKGNLRVSRRAPRKGSSRARDMRESRAYSDYRQAMGVGRERGKCEQEIITFSCRRTQFLGVFIIPAPVAHETNKRIRGCETRVTTSFPCCPRKKEPVNFRRKRRLTDSDRPRRVPPRADSRQ